MTRLHVIHQSFWNVLNAVDITLMEWLPNGPELNLIEHLWEVHKAQV